MPKDFVNLYQEPFSPPIFLFEKFFDPSLHYSAVFLGTRFSGKTSFIGWLYAELRKRYDLIVWFCGSPAAAIYQDFLNDKDLIFVYDNYSESIMEDIFSFQKESGNFLNVAVMMDDMVSNKVVKWAEKILQAFVRGRNSNMSIFIAAQDDTLISPVARRNLDFCFLFTVGGDGPEKVAKKWLLSVFPFESELKYKSESKRCLFLMDFYQKHTLDHGMLVISYREKDCKLYQFRVPTEDIASKTQYKIKESE